MMKATTLYEGKSHQWVIFGRDEDKSPNIIDTNQCLIKCRHETILLDPGGVELFASMLAAITDIVPVESITHIFASHQDPDVISSLGLWDRTLNEATLYAPAIWEGFIRHFGCNTIKYAAVPDDGATIFVGGTEFNLIPAHYVHSSGNFSVYDPEAKILMSGDIGAALLPLDAPMFVEDFSSHISKMKMFHQRWMPSNKAKNNWIKRVRKLEIDMMVPQHGAIFNKEDAQKFLDWFEELEVGIAITDDEVETEEQAMLA